MFFLLLVAAVLPYFYHLLLYKSSFLKAGLGISSNVPRVYDVFTVAIAQVKMWRIPKRSRGIPLLDEVAHYYSSFKKLYVLLPFFDTLNNPLSVTLDSISSSFIRTNGFHIRQLLF